MSSIVEHPSIFSNSKFPLGNLFVTRNVLTTVSFEEVWLAVGRHRVGDWGELDNEDWEGNNRCLLNNRQLLSVYTALNGVVFWVITSPDRSNTKVVLRE